MAEFNPELNKNNSLPSRQEGAAPKKKRGCVNCVYFEVTWDPAKPRGCKYFGFKGLDFPEKQVRITTNVKTCPAFEQKL